MLDQSKSRESRMVSDALTGSGLFKITGAVENHGELEQSLLQGKVDLGFVIPPDFSRKIHKGETSDIQILADGSMSNMASIRLSYVAAILD